MLNIMNKQYNRCIPLVEILSLYILLQHSELSVSMFPIRMGMNRSIGLC